jgi:hypothetical protein
VPSASWIFTRIRSLSICGMKEKPTRPVLISTIAITNMPMKARKVM